MGSGAASIRDDAVRPDAVAILRALPGAYLVLNVDDDLTVAYATDGYVAATQMPRERLVGRPFAAVYGSEDGLNLHDSLRRVLATGRAEQLPATPLTFERAGVANPPGRQRYWSISHSLVSGEGESRAYLLHELIDQTEHREREDELREALSLVSFAGDVARIGGWSVDLRAGVVTWSDVVCDIHEVPHGFSTDVASAIDFYAEESRPIITERFQACVEHGEPFDEELVLSTATGRRVPVRAIGEAVYDDDGQVVLVHGAFQDQTDLRQIEAALLASHRRFRQFAEALQVIVWTALADGSVDYVNPAFWKYTGLAPDDVDLRTGEWISTVHPDDRDRVFAEWQSIMTVGGEYSLQFRLRRADGEYRAHLVSATPIHDDGVLARWYGTAIDVEDAVRERDRAAAVAAELTQTLNAMNDGFFTLDSEWRFVFVNDALARMSRGPREELVGRSMWDVFPDARDTIAWEAYHEAAATQTPRTFEMTYEPLGVTVDVTIYPEAERTAVFVRDVTSAREAERRLAESEERFRGVARATTHAVWDRNFVTNEVWWSEGIETLFGLNREDFPSVADLWEDRIHPDDAGPVLESLRAALAHGPDEWRREYRFRRSDDVYVPVLDRGTILRDDAGVAIRMVGGMNDLSERHAAIRQIEEQARFLDEANDGIFVRSLDHRITYWNAGAARLYGWEAHDAVGADVRALLYPPDAWPAHEAANDEVIQTGQWRGRVRKLRRDGELVTVDATWTLIEDEHGEPTAVLAINRDVTEEVALQTQLEQIQRLEVLGQLTGGIAHDFNNLLTVVIGSTELIAGSVPPDSLAQRQAETARVAALRGAELTRRLLAFARRQPLQPHPRSVNDIVAGVQPLLRQALGERIRIELELDSEIWSTMVDQPQLESCLINLAVNARDAMPGGGRILIETQNTELDEDYTREHVEVAPGEYVLIALSDSGTGMTREVLAKAFEPFFTTKQPGAGTGLGLSMVYGFVKQSGGHVKIYSEPGHGTVVKIYLPRSTAEATSEPRELARSTRGGDEHVLVVEDDDLVRANVTEQLLSFGYRVTSAASARKALEILESGVAIDLLFSDIVMPDMDGRELAKIVNQTYPGLPILLTSGYTEHLALGFGAASGWHLLSKPYTRRDLAEHLRAAFDGTS